MNQCEETEEGVHPSETPLCGQHDNQTKAQSPEQQHKPDSQVLSNPMVLFWVRSRYVSLSDPEQQQKPDSQVLSKPMVLFRVRSRSASLPTRLNFGKSLFSHPLKKVATADRYSVLSSDSWLDSDGFLSSDSEKDVAPSDDDSDQSSCSRISLGSPASSVSSCVSNQSKRSTDRDIYFKKKCTRAIGQCDETEEGVLPSETPLCGQHDNQTKAQSPEQLLKPDSQVLSKPVMCIEGPLRAAASLSAWPDFQGFRTHSLKKVATDDGDSVTSSDSWENEKTSSPITQELVVGSSAGMETKSMYPPVAVQTSPPQLSSLQTLLSLNKKQSLKERGERDVQMNLSRVQEE